VVRDQKENDIPISSTLNRKNIWIRWK
jgi:hypothetical protein